MTLFALAAPLALLLFAGPVHADEACTACSAGVLFSSDTFDVGDALSDGTWIYAAGCEAQRSGSWLVIKRMPATGGAFEALATLAACEGRSVAIQLEERSLVAAVAGQNQSWIWRIPKEGGDATLLTTRAGSISPLLGDATHFYWIETREGVGLLHRMSRSGGVVEPIGPAIPGLRHFVVDSAFVYASAVYAGEESGIYRIDKSSGTTGKITSEHAGSLTVDEGHVYWSDGYRIKRMEKASGTVELLLEAGAWSTSSYDVMSASGGVLYYVNRGTRGPCPGYDVVVRWNDREQSSLGMIGYVTSGACEAVYATPVCWMVPSSSQITRTCLTVPRIHALSETLGPEEGGQAVTIHGAHLEDVARVAFGGNDGAIISGTPDELRVITPRGTGTVQLRLFTRDGKWTALDGAYTYDPAVLLRGRRPVRR